jgi:hypothetical protein
LWVSFDCPRDQCHSAIRACPLFLKSDIDLAVKGLRDSIFFEVLGKLLVTLDHPVDLLSLEDENRLIALLRKRGELLRVA